MGLRDFTDKIRQRWDRASTKTEAEREVSTPRYAERIPGGHPATPAQARAAITALLLMRANYKGSPPCSGTASWKLTTAYRDARRRANRASSRSRAYNLAHA
jgi:hypothetical protein